MDLEKIKEMEFEPLKLGWLDRFLIQIGRKKLGKREKILSFGDWCGPFKYYKKGKNNYIKSEDFYNTFNPRDIPNNRVVRWSLEMWTYPKYKYQIIDIYHSMNFKKVSGSIIVYYSMKKNRLIRKKEESFEDWIKRISATFEFEKVKMEKADQKRKEINDKRLSYYSELKKNGDVIVI